MSSAPVVAVTSPVWFLDVDGVLNADPSDTPLPWGDEVTTMVTVSMQGLASRYPIRHSPTLVRELTDLRWSGLVAIRWLTSWNARANRPLGRKLGLPLFPVAHPSISAGDDAVKLDVVLAEARSGRPIIWADDQVITEEARELIAATGVPHLLIAPDPTVGLTPDHLAQVNAFVRSHP
jgi:hypothetical protein